MNDPLYCWMCAQSLIEVILPLSRREVCSACDADQHVCKMCRFYNTNSADACTEDRAEAVTEKERANFCDYFEPHGLVCNDGTGGQTTQAREALAELFGEVLTDGGDQLETESPLSDADRAKAALNDLFNKD